MRLCRFTRFGNDEEIIINPAYIVNIYESVEHEIIILIALGLGHKSQISVRGNLQDIAQEVDDALSSHSSRSPHATAGPWEKAK